MAESLIETLDTLNSWKLELALLLEKDSAKFIGESFTLKSYTEYLDVAERFGILFREDFMDFLDRQRRVSAALLEVDGDAKYGNEGKGVEMLEVDGDAKQDELPPLVPPTVNVPIPVNVTEEDDEVKIIRVVHHPPRRPRTNRRAPRRQVPYVRDRWYYEEVPEVTPRRPLLNRMRAYRGERPMRITRATWNNFLNRDWPVDSTGAYVNRPM